jgi:hypothetical protein
MTQPPQICAPYAARAFSVAPVSRHGAWRIKRYYVHVPGDRLDATAFQDIERRSRAELPSPARAAGRAGTAFTIGHQGRERCYFVLAWWDNGNELPLRVWVSERDGSKPRWRPAKRSESVCVWDLDIVWFERCAYVRHMMPRRRAPDVSRYLRSAHEHAVRVSLRTPRRG